MAARGPVNGRGPRSGRDLVFRCYPPELLSPPKKQKLTFWVSPIFFRYGRLERLSFELYIAAVPWLDLRNFNIAVLPFSDYIKSDRFLSHFVPDRFAAVRIDTHPYLVLTVNPGVYQCDGPNLIRSVYSWNDQSYERRCT